MSRSPEYGPAGLGRRITFLNATFFSFFFFYKIKFIESTKNETVKNQNGMNCDNNYLVVTHAQRIIITLGVNVNKFKKKNNSISYINDNETIFFLLLLLQTPRRCLRRQSRTTAGLMTAVLAVQSRCFAAQSLAVSPTRRQSDTFHHGASASLSSRRRGRVTSSRTRRCMSDTIGDRRHTSNCTHGMPDASRSSRSVNVPSIAWPIIDLICNENTIVLSERERVSATRDRLVIKNCFLSYARETIVSAIPRTRKTRSETNNRIMLLSFCRQRISSKQFINLNVYQLNLTFSYSGKRNDVVAETPYCCITATVEIAPPRLTDFFLFFFSSVQTTIRLWYNITYYSIQ